MVGGNYSSLKTMIADCFEERHLPFILVAVRNNKGLETQLEKQFK
jgi:hypothetical protein